MLYLMQLITVNNVCRTTQSSVNNTQSDYVFAGPHTFTENETIAKYEIMDGAPVKGESIPIRVFLAGYDLAPTMRDINKKFSVRYYLNLVLMDEEDRRYFKQQVRFTKSHTLVYLYPFFLLSYFINNQLSNPPY